MIPAKYAPELRFDPRLDASAVIDMVCKNSMYFISSIQFSG